MKGFILIVFLVLISQIRAELIDYPNYYTRSMLSKLEQADANSKKSVLSSNISNNKALSYKTARKYLFGKVDLQKNTSGHYIKDIYCRKIYTAKHGVKQMEIPNSKYLNCEHVWPQSKFNKNISNKSQKGDLHHLAPSMSKANFSRSNTAFAEVTNPEVVDATCTESVRGDATNSNRRGFEPAEDSKGNVARALFYFATRYNLNITSSEEEYLRKWHRQDPVDQREENRNQLIFEVQGNRNPYIDQPSLVSQISDF